MTTFEPPPPGDGRRGAPRTRALAALAADLRAVPGAWARVGEYKTAASAITTASLIRRGRLAAFRDAGPGAFEAEARTVDGQARVYARFVGTTPVGGEQA